MSAREYPGEFCDTDKPQEKRLVTLTRTHQGKWYIFENVPAAVCPNCGHRYYDGAMLLELEQMMKDKPDSARPIEGWAVSLPIAK